MKKVAIIKSDILPLSETFIKEQVLSLQRWQGKLFGAQLIKDGLPLDDINYTIYRSERVPWLTNQFRRFHALFNLPEKSLMKALSDYAPDLIHVHFGTVAVRCWPSLSQFRIPTIVTLHGYDITTYKKYWKRSKNPVKRFYPERLLKMAQSPQVHFIAVSEAIRQRAIEYGIPAEKLTVQYIGIDFKKFNVGHIPIEKRKKRILFVGRLTEKKGVMYLLQAFKDINKEMPDAELVIAGDGHEYQSALRFSKINNLPVNFLGAISHERVKQELDKARVFCLPSVCASTGDREGFGMVILEAQACGVPVVSSAYGGAIEGIIDGETGFSFPEKDVSALTNKLLFLLKDEVLLKAMSKGAPAFVKERFDISKCTSSLEDFYDDLV